MVCLLWMYYFPLSQLVSILSLLLDSEPLYYREFPEGFVLNLIKDDFAQIDL